jgi:hypothetical protein
MQSNISRRFSGIITFLILISFAFNASLFAQSKTQKSEKPKGDQKKNERTDTKKTEEQRKQEEEEANAEVDKEVLKIKTNIVNVDAVVINKKTKEIIFHARSADYRYARRRIQPLVGDFRLHRKSRNGTGNAGSDPSGRLFSL